MVCASTLSPPIIHGGGWFGLGQQGKSELVKSNIYSWKLFSHTGLSSATQLEL